jgi:hypothetical protein
VPIGPEHQNCPADETSNAVKGMRTATGEASDDLPDEGKNKAAQELKRKGANALTPPTRDEIARMSPRQLYDLFGTRYPKTPT